MTHPSTPYSDAPTRRTGLQALKDSALAVLLVGAAALAVSLLAMPVAHAQTKEVRIGYQKYGTLIILKARGTLEKRLAPLGTSVKWVEFAFGPPLLEAINVGAIDYGTVGEAPPIFALAAGADLVYIANEPPALTAEGILVRKDSPIKTPADLKGKKVAVAKGSNANYLLVKVLEKAGLKWTDIQPIYLPPADARAAFETGAVDAWSIWDPFLASGQTQIGAQIIADAKGVANNYQYFLASRSYAQKNADIIKAIVEETAKIDEWGGRNKKEVGAFLAREVGLDAATAELAASRLAYGIKPISTEVLADQQRVADTFYEFKLIPKEVTVKDAVLKPAP